MRITSAVAIGAFAATILVASASAQAQEDAGTIEGVGYRVGERTVVHPTIGSALGMISNVFYQERESTASGLFQLVGAFSLDPMDSDNGGTPPDFDFSVGGRFIYEEYLSTRNTVTAQRNLGIGLDLSLDIGPAKTFPVHFENHFLRSSRPTNFESSRTLTRDINTFDARVSYKPGGRNISGRLGLTNTIDIFESDASAFANRLNTLFKLGVDWQFLPITRFFAETSYGIFGPLGAGNSEPSTPIRGKVGVATALTESTTLRADAGYAYGGFTSASFANFIYHLEGGYRYSPMGRIILILDRDFNDSINANYYGEYMVKLVLDQQIERVLLKASVAGRIRNYGGVNPMLGGGTTRDDVIISAATNASYVLRGWLSLDASYDFSSVKTDFRTRMGADVDDPSYIRHQVLAGATAAF